MAKTTPAAKAPAKTEADYHSEIQALRDSGKGEEATAKARELEQMLASAPKPAPPPEDKGEE